MLEPSSIHQDCNPGSPDAMDGALGNLAAYCLFFFSQTKRRLGQQSAELSDVTSEAAAAGTFLDPADRTTRAMSVPQDIGFQSHRGGPGSR